MKKVFYLLLNVVCLLLAFSCSNFLAGSGLKEDIDDAIERAKAPVISVKIYPEIPESGVIIGNAEKSVKSGETVSLSFNCGSNYCFLGWAAYVNGVEDTKEKYVHIEPSADKETEAIATIKEYAAVIEIKALCAEYLLVSSVSPEWGAVYPRDTSIEVNFSTNISINSFRFTMEDLKALGLTEESEGALTLPSYIEVYKDSDDRIYAYKNLIEATPQVRFKNIEVTCEDESLAEHFFAPIVIGNVLKILANHNNPMTVGADEQKQIRVNISDKIFSSMNIPLKAEKSWGYRVSSRLVSDSDDLDPIAGDLFVARDMDSLRNGAYFTLNDINSFSDKDVSTNCTTKNFAVSYSAKDTESGIQKVCINEYYSYTSDGIQVPVSTTTTEILPDKFIYAEDGYTISIESEYTLQKYVNDGVYSFEIWAEDNHNNKTGKKTFSVITHNDLDISEWRLYNSQENVNNFTFETKKSILFKDYESKVDFDILCGTDPDNITTSLKSKLVKTTEDGVYSFVLDDTVCEGVMGDKPAYILVNAKDVSGYEKSFLQIVPPAVKNILSFYRQGESDLSNSSTTSRYIRYDFTNIVNGIYGFSYSTGSAYYTYSDTCYANYAGYIREPNKQTTPVSCCFTSDYGTVYGKKGNTIEYTYYKPGDTSSNIPLKDEQGNDITYEITKGEKVLDYTVYHVTVSGRVPAVNTSNGYYAGYVLHINGYTIYFEGTETSFITKDKITGSSLNAVDPSHYSWSSAGFSHYEESEESTISCNKNGEGLSCLVLIAVRDLYNNTLVTTTENMLQWCKVGNADFTGDYVRIFPANKNSDTSVYLKEKGTVYYKKMSQSEYDYLYNNAIEVIDSSNNIQRTLNTNLLIENGVYTYNQIEKEFDSREITLTVNKDYRVDDSYYMPIYDFEEGYYMFFVRLEDSKDKKGWMSLAYQKKIATFDAKAYTSVTCSDTELVITATNPRDFHTGNYPASQYYCIRMQANRINDGAWENVGTAQIGMTDGDTSLTIQNENTTPWMKIYRHDLEPNHYLSKYYFNQAKGSLDTVTYSAPVYVYPSGTTTPEEDPENLENMIEGKKLSILCNKSTLVQTFYAEKNYGSKVEDWEMYTKKDHVINPVILTENGNYTIPEDKIPDGAYYCAIARFSDGCTLISSVKQK